MLPGINVGITDLKPYFVAKPWNAIDWLPVTFYPLAIGLGFAGLSYIAGMRAAREAVARRRRRMERTREAVERGVRAGLARLRHPGRRARTGGEPSKGRGEIEAGS